ncbi:DUF1093 domain-containing protein [Paenibacillus dendritiformis]|uniref:DUF1093 domain-containing protein n=1 Tax=Paenibacillus dendritiformis TaxID=130049 RepID=UPI003B971A37
MDVYQIGFRLGQSKKRLLMQAHREAITAVCGIQPGAEWGTTKMYVHITANGKEETIGADSGDPFSRYYYTLTAYDEEGSA